MSSALARLVNGHRSLANPAPLSAKQVSSGSILDYEVEKCLDDDNNQRCSTPFLVSKSTCYNLSWKTDGALSHTTIEVRDAGSNEIVYFRDTDGEWTPEKGEVSRSPLAEVAMFALVAGHRVSTWQILCRMLIPRCSSFTSTSSQRSTSKATRLSTTRSPPALKVRFIPPRSHCQTYERIF